MTDWLYHFLGSTNSRKKHFTEKYLSGIRFKGTNVLFSAKSNIIRLAGIVCGSNVTVNHARINATAGVSFGNGTTVMNGSKITTVSPDGVFNPVVIGSGHTISGEISSGTVLENTLENNNSLGEHSPPIFVLSTGRSGSKAIVHLLNQHEKLDFYHDSFPHINKWAMDLLYNNESYAQISHKLETLFNSIAWKENKVHGQSDQKLVPLVPILNELYPNAKFIWLIRKADSFINSSYPRGWFDNQEFDLNINKNEFYKKEKTPSKFDAAHRVNGLFLEDKVENWNSMSAFERNCWYWTYWNNLIESSLEKISSDRWIKIKLNELSSNTKKIQDFLDVAFKDIKASKVNVANYKKLSKSDWTPEMINIYNFHCADSMKKWFE